MVFGRTAMPLCLPPIIFLMISGSVVAGCPELDSILAGNHRNPANVGRDLYRHPCETLAFFGVKPDMTVVEVEPGHGWYTEILAPFLRERGKLYLAVPDLPFFRKSPYQMGLRHEILEKIRNRPDLYDRMTLTSRDGDMGPPGRVDRVLAFRNVHNWIAGRNVLKIFAGMFRVLKSGGLLGIEEHRAFEGASLADMARTGYTTEEFIIDIARASGFRLAGRSNINSNPQDTKDYPGGLN
jgi:predicted methyltransferase